MNTNYYFLANILPPIQIGETPDLSFIDFTRMLGLNLKDRDQEKVAVIRRYFDLQNLRLLWQQEELDLRGNLSELELEEALLMEEGFPDYLFQFLKKYEGLPERLRHFPALITHYFREEASVAEGFLQDYLTFEREWRLVLMGFRAKKLQRDLTTELQFEDPTDPLVAQLLAQKDSKNYEPPFRYEELKPLFEEHAEAPFDLHKAMCEYRFKKINALMEGDLFSIDSILGYLAQLIIVEKWLELDDQQGTQIVERIIEEVR